jgi:hypothetical protein
MTCSVCVAFLGNRNLLTLLGHFHRRLMINDIFTYNVVTIHVYWRRVLKERTPASCTRRIQYTISSMLYFKCRKNT